MPFVVRWPGTVAPGVTSEQTICFTDLLATLSDISGVALPDGVGRDSHSLLPVLSAEALTTSRRHTVLKANASVVRQQNWKLITHLGSGGFSSPRRVKPVAGGPRGQLYDLSKDPGERDNLWSRRPDVVARLQAVLAGERH